MNRELNIVLTSKFKLPHFFLATSINLLIMCAVWYIYSVTSWTLFSAEGQENVFPGRFQQFLILTIPVLASELYVIFKLRKNLRKHKFRKAKNYAINIALNLIIWAIGLYSLQ